MQKTQKDIDREKKQLARTGQLQSLMLKLLGDEALTSADLIRAIDEHLDLEGRGGVLAAIDVAMEAVDHCVIHGDDDGRWRFGRRRH